MKYTDKKIGKLPFASAHYNVCWPIKLQGDKKDYLDKFSSLPILMKEAMINPGVKQSYYFEENGYEYEHHATWNPEKQIMSTNLPCPYRYNHHIGSTCKHCGQKD